MEQIVEKQPPADDAHVAVGSTRFSDGQTQTQATLASARVESTPVVLGGTVAGVVAPVQHAEPVPQPDMHPKAVAAREAAANAKQAKAESRAQKLQALATLTDSYHLKYIDLKPHPSMRTQVLTLAYNGGRVIRVATTVLNPRDQFNKLDGRIAAANNFNMGHFVFLRRPAGIKVDQFLRAMFTY